MKRPSHCFMATQTRDGLLSSFVICPTESRWATFAEFLLERFGHLDRDKLQSKIRDGGFRYDDGSAVGMDDDYQRGARLWYFRQVSDEQPVPFDYELLYEDDTILVIDKPHFLPTAPVGHYLHHTALTRLRARTGNYTISPAHRLDKATAGVLLFTKKAEARQPYQQMFEHKRAQKTYLAVCQNNAQLEDDFRIELRMQMNSHNRFMHVAEGPANSVTHGKRLVHKEQVGLFQLQPQTGKQHQLRLHMAQAGAQIVNDLWYPDLIQHVEDDFSKPLQLLAQKLEFTDPITGRDHCFESRRSLALAPD